MIQSGRIRIFVVRERAQRHHLRYGHASWPAGSCVVNARTGAVLSRDEPPAAVKDLIEEHREEIEGAWDRVNAKE